MIVNPLTPLDETRDLLSAARRRANDLSPYSPAWDAAMAGVEDLERQLWGLRPVVATADRYALSVVPVSGI